MVLILTTLSSYGQGESWRKVKDLPAFRKQFASESAAILTIKSQFVQEKILSAVEEKMISKGDFFFKRSNKVRISYLQPFVYTLILNGDRMLIRDGQKENRVNVKSNKLFQQVNRILVDCVQGTILESGDFTFEVFENAGMYKLELKPSAKALRGFFDSIVLKVDKKDFSVIGIEMNEESGDQTIITFVQKNLNVPVADEIFSL